MTNELLIGLQMAKYSKLPWELGYGEIKDMALVTRAEHCAWVYQTAQLFANSKNWSAYNQSQLELINRLMELNG